MKNIAPQGNTKMPVRGVVCALFAALLFGTTTPFAKGLLNEISPVLLAGLFYLGSGIGLGIYLLTTELAAQITGQEKNSEASLQKTDLPWLAGAILFGGIIAPVLLMLGLSTIRASSASLFLNLEGVFTALIAWFVFHENFDKRIFLGMLAIVLGGIILSATEVETAALTANFSGSLLIAGACLGWAIDNNLTRKVSNANPAQITCIKGLSAGLINVSLAMKFTEAALTTPGPIYIGTALLVGFLGYGISLVFFVLALRHLGTARSGAYFALAPFVGALIAIVLVNEPITPSFTTASALMALGLWLHLSESHSHCHGHEATTHAHKHSHDEHHNHIHLHISDTPPGEPHTHVHSHEPLAHSHAHFPDAHHRHKHF
ncbi:MAG: EamA family transporter [Candidatus Melainabacteria bacterium]|nr:EamA family transporter [Candidatus Melainabacteria bacterium]